jgi:hypothetical protein
VRTEARTLFIVIRSAARLKSCPYAKTRANRGLRSNPGLSEVRSLFGLGFGFFGRKTTAAATFVLGVRDREA